MSDVVADLRAECTALDELLVTLAPEDWEKVTDFYAWTVRDQVMHLHQIDRFGMISLTEPERFPEEVKVVRAGQARGYELSHRMRDDFGALDAAAMHDLWKRTWQEMCAIFERTDPEHRVPWFGPEMSVASFAAARQMEVWAHGQDIYDLFGARRDAHDRIRNICDLGVRTLGWSFRNRGLERPGPVEVRLTAPSGAEWVWNDGAEETIAGPAEDFALVVTQRRHVDDTRLAGQGPGARRWMEIAQCFAGAPAEGPAPGARAAA